MKKIQDYINNQINEIENYNIPEQDMMTEMANLSQKHTELPVVIWVETGVTRGTKHNIPRLKFQNSTSQKISTKNLIPISISEEPEILIKNFDMKNLKISRKDFQMVKEWIIKHRETLIDYWNQNFDTVELISILSDNK